MARYAQVIDDVSSYRGAPMGRPSYAPDPDEADKRTNLFRLRFTDGCYDSGGAYWGSPANVYCADGGVVGRMFLRAFSRAEAIAKVREKFPSARFYNEVTS